VNQGNDDKRGNAITAHLLISVGHSDASLHHNPGNIPAQPCARAGLNVPVRIHGKKLFFHPAGSFRKCNIPPCCKATPCDLADMAYMGLVIGWPLITGALTGPVGSCNALIG
jgi:hypothetical protein